eukprot:CAMPEP_0206602562 /NCGR_PEP_ID=MMETSP0325_2-20121206/47491_1 /ASSEMBLY_ACC=CAM_ASM_000347 /TAXON_ID=2866 /ORGANISM="Crypthecodinium cohnii, Strain Seligo" /LENGTH=719 /DNA_ID=CAMNT_0054115133 /DNA_START=101 /DNA_END=2256 /DNA_ORIENTATION=-
MEDSEAASSTMEAFGFAGHGLNKMCDEADSKHRLLHLTPTPVWELPARGSNAQAEWVPAYALSPSTTVWPDHVRNASACDPARVVGVVGATSAGKSWLVGKLLEDSAPKPSRLEEHFDGVVLQSMTSDINMYPDDQHEVYYLDFEGTYGTQPLQGSMEELIDVMARVPDEKSWEVKRRQSLKECFQPTVAYLTCNVVVFLTREKLVCSRAMEECEHFAHAANGRVVSALPPALILVQNCCRPSEGLFNPEQCTAAFKRTHLPQGTAGSWHGYFRSVDCFCIPDEHLVCKRSGFDGEEVSKQIIEKLKKAIRDRLEEDLRYRLEQQVNLSQLQWFSVVSALCRIVNDGEKVQMSALYTYAGATLGGAAEMKSILLELMSGPLPNSNSHGSSNNNNNNNSSRSTSTDKSDNVAEQLQGALAIIARFAVRRELASDELEGILLSFRGLFPCGACADESVERFDRSGGPVSCGQMRLFHNALHRSSTLVRTVDADWLTGIGEWLRGGVTFAWPGEFECHEDYRKFDSTACLQKVLAEELEGYRLEKCLEGLAPLVGLPWVLKAHASLQNFGLRYVRDSSRMCVVCMAQGSAGGFFSRWWSQQEPSTLPTCNHCMSILERHDLCRANTREASHSTLSKGDASCESCVRKRSSSWTGSVREVGGHSASRRGIADHRLRPCGCCLCLSCMESAIQSNQYLCPLCGYRVRNIIDERALVKTNWPAAV